MFGFIKWTGLQLARKPFTFNFSELDSSRKQIKHSVDYLLGNKLYLHHFDLFRACGPQHGQRDVSTVYFPVENQPSVLFVFYYCPFNQKNEINAFSLGRSQLLRHFRTRHSYWRLYWQVVIQLISFYPISWLKSKNKFA